MRARIILFAVLLVIVTIKLACDNTPTQSPMVNGCEGMEVTLKEVEQGEGGWRLDIVNLDSTEYVIYNTAFLVKIQMKDPHGNGYCQAGIKLKCELDHHGNEATGYTDVFDPADGRGYIWGENDERTNNKEDACYIYTDEYGQAYLMIGMGDKRLYFGTGHDPALNINADEWIYTRFQVKITAEKTNGEPDYVQYVNGLLCKVPDQLFFGTYIGGVYCQGVFDCSYIQLGQMGGRQKLYQSQEDFRAEGVGEIERYDSYDDLLNSQPQGKIPPRDEIYFPEPNGVMMMGLEDPNDPNHVPADWHQCGWMVLDFDFDYGWSWRITYDDDFNSWQFDQLDPNETGYFLQDVRPLTFWIQMGQDYDLGFPTSTVTLRSYHPGNEDPNYPIVEPHEISRMTIKIYPIFIDMFGFVWYATDLIVPNAHPDGQQVITDPANGNEYYVIYAPPGARLELLWPGGDFNGNNNHGDLEDLAMFQQKWLTSCDPNWHDWYEEPNDPNIPPLEFEPYDLGYDFNLDGYVDMKDMALFSGAYDPNDS